MSICIQCKCEKIDTSDLGTNYEGFTYNKVKCKCCKSYVYCKWCYENFYFNGIAYMEHIYCYKCMKTYCEYEDLPKFTGTCTVYRKCDYKNESNEKCYVDLFKYKGSFLDNLPHGIIQIYDNYSGHQKFNRIKFKFEAYINENNKRQFLKHKNNLYNIYNLQDIITNGFYKHYYSNQIYLQGTRINGLFTGLLHIYGSYNYFTPETLKIHKINDAHIYFQENPYLSNIDGYDNTDFRLCKCILNMKIINYPMSIGWKKLDYYTKDLMNHRNDSYLHPRYETFNERSIINPIYHDYINERYCVSIPIGDFIVYSEDYIPLYKAFCTTMIEDGFEVPIYDKLLYEFDKNDYHIYKRISLKNGLKDGTSFIYDGRNLIFCNYKNGLLHGNYFKCHIRYDTLEKLIFNYANVISFQNKKPDYNGYYSCNKYYPKDEDYSVLSIVKDAEKTFESETNIEYKKVLIKKYIFDKKYELYEKIFEVMNVDNFKDYFFKNNNDIIIECTYKDDKIIGIYNEYSLSYSSKRIRKSCFYNNEGLLDGTYTEFNHDGLMTVSRKYKNGVMIDDEYTYYYIINEKNKNSYDPDKKYIRCIETHNHYNQNGKKDGVCEKYFMLNYEDLKHSVDSDYSGTVNDTDMEDIIYENEHGDYSECEYAGKLKSRSIYDNNILIEHTEYYDHLPIRTNVIKEMIKRKELNDESIDIDLHSYISYIGEGELNENDENMVKYVYENIRYYQNNEIEDKRYTKNPFINSHIGNRVNYYSNKKKYFSGAEKYEYNKETKKIDYKNIGKHYYFYDNAKNSIEKEILYDIDGSKVYEKRFNKSGKEIN